MPLMTKTQVESLTDALAASIAAAASGFRTAALSPTTRSFWEIIDVIGNGTIEAALTPAAIALDSALWDESALIQNRLSPVFGPLLNTINSQITTDATYSSFDAYLTGIGAQVAPQIAQIAPSPLALGAALSPANVFSPAIASQAYDAVYVGTDGSLSNETADAASAATADVNLFAADGDVVYLGLNTLPAGTYDYLTFALSTAASADIGLSIKYFDGVQWVALTAHTDADGVASVANAGTQGFTKSGLIRYTVPPAWQRTNVNPAGDAIFAADLTPRYYLRLERTADTVVTPPVLTSVRNGIGLGALLITAANTATFVAGSAVNALYDAPNNINLRALTPVSASATVALTYTNRAATASRTATASAWSNIAALDDYHTDLSAYVPLQVAGEGCAAVTGASITTTATAGIIVVESAPARTVAR